MATNRELLKEAIADAKSIKEMAIANAKAALEETITPRLKEMLSAKIQEIDEEDSKSMEEMKYEEDDTDKKMEEGMYEEDDTTVDEAGFEPMTATSDDQGFDSLKGNIPEGDDLDEVDLEELLAELEKEDKEEKSEELNEAEEEDEVEDDEEESKEEEGEPLDLEDMTDEDLKKMIEDVIADMVASGELEGGDVEGEEEDEEVGMSDEMSDEMDEEEVDLAELLREIEEEVKTEELSEKKKYGGKKGDVPASKRGDKKDTAEEEGVEDYKKKLKEAKLKIESLENKLQEKDLQLNEAVKETNATNLLNAKLLYSNKIFRSKNLNESQKVKVLESFDKANTTKEAKLVYETLSEGLKVKKNTIKENLGRASKTTTIPKTKKPIVESNEVFARMQKLAGIIK